MPGVVHGQRRFTAVAIGAALLAVTACGIGLWSARSRAMIDPAARAGQAYSKGKWAAAAEARPSDACTFARTIRQRCGSWPGHRPGSAATTPRWRSISVGSTKKAIEAEDHLSCMGVACTSDRGRRDAAARAWKQGARGRPGLAPIARGAGSPSYPGPSSGGGDRWSPSGSAGNRAGRHAGR